jgi:hypothetical protein
MRMFYYFVIAYGIILILYKEPGKTISFLFFLLFSPKEVCRMQ